MTNNVSDKEKKQKISETMSLPKSIKSVKSYMNIFKGLLIVNKKNPISNRNKHWKGHRIE